MGPEIETFLGPKMATSEASAIWAQKVLNLYQLILSKRAGVCWGGVVTVHSGTGSMFVTARERGYAGVGL